MAKPSYCSANDLALLRVTGRDARQFLHAQTTQSLVDLPRNEFRLAAWLTPKGRVRALFDVVPDGDAFWLVTQADSADWLAEQMGRFVLRADVRLEPAREHVVHSLLGDSRGWLEARGITLPPRQVTRGDGALWFTLAQDRVDLIAKHGEIEPALADLPIAGTDVAALAAIRAGRPEVPNTLRDRYVPQMLNLDRLGAVSFTKGCYPGQEIVARTQNLGEVKRRLARFRIGAGERPRPGDGVVTREGESAGEINRVAATDGGCELLAVAKMDVVGLALESDGRGLEPLPLASDV